MTDSRGNYWVIIRYPRYRIKKTCPASTFLSGFKSLCMPEMINHETVEGYTKVLILRCGDAQEETVSTFWMQHSDFNSTWAME